MISKRKLASLFKFFITAILLTSCQKSVATSKQILRLNLAEDPVSLDPREVRTVRDLTVTKQLFEGLTRIDENGVPMPALAERIEISDDLKSYTFFLRKAYWSDGEPITAFDIEQSWKEVLDSSFGADYAYLFFPIKNSKTYYLKKSETVGFKAQDERTFIVELEFPTPYFLDLTAFPTFFPVRKQSYSGPFQPKSWLLSQELKLEKNELYWDVENVRLDEIVCSMIADKHTEGVLFEKGELDWLGQPTSQPISPELFEKMKACGKISSYPVAGTFWLLFNTKKEPFTDLKLRKALGYSISRAEIISQFLKGDQKIATGVIPPCMGLGCISHFKDGNLEEARQQLQEFLVEKKWETLPRISLTYPANERSSKIGQFLKETWRKTLGIDVELNPFEFKVYKSKIKAGQFQVALGDWIADYNHPLSFFEYFRYAMNDSQWQNDAFISLLEATLAEKEGSKQKALMSKAEKILIEEMPVSPIYHYSFDYAKRENLQGVLLSPLGIADFKYAHFE